MKRIAALALGLTLLSFSALPASVQSTPQTTAAPDKAADITGKWHFVYQTDGGERDRTGVFKQEGDQVTGKFEKSDVKGTFKDGDLDLAFPFDSDEANMTATLKLKGKLKDGKLSGTWQFADYEGTFVATRSE